MGVRGCPRMPSESNFDHAAVSQEGGCQLNHLHGDVIHPCNVPTQHKINPEACILPRPRALAMSLASWYTAAAVYSNFYSFFVMYTGIHLARLVPRRLQRSTALAVYSGLQSTALQRSTVYSSLHSPSGRKRGDLTPPAVIASRDEPAVLRTRSQWLPGLSRQHR